MIVFRIGIEDLNEAVMYLYSLGFAVRQSKTARKTIYARINSLEKKSMATIRSFVTETPTLINYVWLSGGWASKNVD